MSEISAKTRQAFERLLPRQSRRRKLAVNLLVSISVTVLFFASAELVSRIWYTPQKFDTGWIFTYDRDKISQLKKKVFSMFSDRVIMTNSEGYRDREITVEKPPNTIRILALGDSVTFGHGVEQNEPYTECLEAMLNRRAKSHGFQVINTAAPGNFALQEYYDLKRGLKFEPDAVIYQFTLNDVIEPYHTLRRFGGGGKDYRGVEDIPYLDYWLSQRSGLYLFLKDVYRKILYRAPTRDDLLREARRRELYSTENLIKKHDDPKIEDAWKEYLKWAQRISDLCEKEDLPCIVLTTPFVFQFVLDDSLAYPQQIVDKFAAEHGLVHVDILKCLQSDFRREMIEKHSLEEDTSYANVIALANRSGEKEIEEFWSRHFLDHDHFSPAGHEYVAEHLFDVVVEALRNKGLDVELR